MMRSEDDILRAFAGLDRVPGSNRKRQESSAIADQRRSKVFGESNGWDASPMVRSIRGVETEMFPISALAHALEKEVVTIRLWEKRGYIPIAPYRLRSKTINGKKVNGNRVYTRELIDIAIEEFSARGLLGAARVEWSRYGDLTDALVLRWKLAINQEQ